MKAVKVSIRYHAWLYVHLLRFWAFCICVLLKLYVIVTISKDLFYLQLRYFLLCFCHFTRKVSLRKPHDLNEFPSSGFSFAPASSTVRSCFTGIVPFLVTSLGKTPNINSHSTLHSRHLQWEFMIFEWEIKMINRVKSDLRAFVLEKMRKKLLNPSCWSSRAVKSSIRVYIHSELLISHFPLVQLYLLSHATPRWKRQSRPCPPLKQNRILTFITVRRYRL